MVVRLRMNVKGVLYGEQWVIGLQDSIAEQVTESKGFQGHEMFADQWTPCHRAKPW